jgi:hypothetical protein
MPPTVNNGPRERGVMAERPQVEAQQRSGLSRREMLRRAGLLGGTLLWVAPAVQSLTPPAYAHVSPGMNYCCQCRHDENRVRCFSGSGTFTAEDCAALCAAQTSPPGGWQVEGFHRDNAPFTCVGTANNSVCTNPNHDFSQ